MSQAAFLEILQVINDPTITWKVKRNLLRDRFELPQESIEQLIPRPEPEDY